MQAWLKQQLGLGRSRFRNPPGGFDAVEDCVEAARIDPLSRCDSRKVRIPDFALTLTFTLHLHLNPNFSLKPEPDPDPVAHLYVSMNYFSVMTYLRSSACHNTCVCQRLQAPML